MKMLNLIELNEVNFDVVENYLQKYPGKFKGFEKLSNFNQITTKSENKYELLEPWIQWASVHTCLKYDDHKIFRLGDIVNFSGQQIFERIEALGYKVGCLSPMNAKNNLKRAAYFIPDPWTQTRPDPSFTSKALHQALRQAVNDNSGGTIALSTYFIVLWCLVTKTQIKNWPTYFKLFKNRHRRWNKALFLDLMLSDLFISYKKRRMSDFSCIFLNAFAHIQHHYMLNSSYYKGNLRNTDTYVKKSEDPIFDAIIIYDKILMDLFEKFNENFIIATGLRQIPVDETIMYYRLRDHEKFLSAIGLTKFLVEPRMSRDFLITFEEITDLEAAHNLLKNSKLNGIRLFEYIDRRENSLFVTLTYSKRVTSHDFLDIQGRLIKISDEFSFVAIKNGHHDGVGYTYSNFALKTLKQGDHVSKIGTEIVNFFEQTNKQAICDKTQGK